MSPETNPDISVGYGFEDEQTLLELELLDDLRKLGVSEYVDLPQASPYYPMSCIILIDIE
jgi:hypothetical protein